MVWLNSDDYAARLVIYIYIYWIGTCQHIEWFCSYGNQMYAPGKRVAANLMPKNHVLESFTCFEIPRTFKFTNTLTYSDYVCVFTPYVWQTKAPLGGKGGAQVPNLKTYSMAMSGTDWLEVPTIYIYLSIHLSIYLSIYLYIYKRPILQAWISGNIPTQFSAHHGSPIDVGPHACAPMSSIHGLKRPARNR